MHIFLLTCVFKMYTLISNDVYLFGKTINTIQNQHNNINNQMRGSSIILSQSVGDVLCKGTYLLSQDRLGRVASSFPRRLNRPQFLRETCTQLLLGLGEQRFPVSLCYKCDSNRGSFAPPYNRSNEYIAPNNI